MNNISEDKRNRLLDLIEKSNEHLGYLAAHLENHEQLSDDEWYKIDEYITKTFLTLQDMISEVHQI
ncbi:hypothetical protein [Siminovitchia fordii]|uniref:Uncharacterized protein n=1 Tax=Siminovitchia fordii TaxID=254759 RepID=A0ABQ4KBH1_9BACI|nr:hypothetical protein [Siminovitchia fordii]GIN22515.1 hypothetical protein J1TS3_36490 [Siminovitchia fordii]